MIIFSITLSGRRVFFVCFFFEQVILTGREATNISTLCIFLWLVYFNFVCLISPVVGLPVDLPACMQAHILVGSPQG